MTSAEMGAPRAVLQDRVPGHSALDRPARWENDVHMRRPLQAAMRKLTRLTRPLALKHAGTPASSTSVVRHQGRRSGAVYATPVVAAWQDDGFLIALPYGDRTDWAKNVLASGKAENVTRGHTYGVDRTEVVPMAEAAASFRPKEQRLQRRFHVESALRVHRVADERH